jgi:hypothetical protein
VSTKNKFLTHIKKGFFKENRFSDSEINMLYELWRITLHSRVLAEKLFRDSFFLNNPPSSIQKIKKNIFQLFYEKGIDIKKAFAFTLLNLIEEKNSNLNEIETKIYLNALKYLGIKKIKLWGNYYLENIEISILYNLKIIPSNKQYYEGKGFCKEEVKELICFTKIIFCSISKDSYKGKIPLSEIDKIKKQVHFLVYENNINKNLAFTFAILCAIQTKNTLNAIENDILKKINGYFVKNMHEKKGVNMFYPNN